MAARPAAAALALAADDGDGLAAADDEPFIEPFTPAQARAAADALGIDLSGVKDAGISSHILAASRAKYAAAKKLYWYGVGVALSMSGPAALQNRELSDLMRQHGWDPRNANNAKNSLDSENIQKVASHSVTRTTIRNLFLNNPKRDLDVATLLVDGAEKRFPIRHGKDVTEYNGGAGWVPLRWQPQTAAEKRVAHDQQQPTEEEQPPPDPAPDPDADDQTEPPPKTKPKRKRPDGDEKEDGAPPQPQPERKDEKEKEKAHEKEDKKQEKKGKVHPLDFDTTSASESEASAGSRRRNKRMKGAVDLARQYPELIQKSVTVVAAELGAVWPMEFAAPYVVRNMEALSDDPLIVAERHPHAFTRASRVPMPDRTLCAEELQPLLPADGELKEYRCYEGKTADTALDTLSRMAFDSVDPKYDAIQHSGWRCHDRRSDVSAKGELGERMRNKSRAVVDALTGAGARAELIPSKRDVQAIGSAAVATAGAHRKAMAETPDESRCRYWTDRTVASEGVLSKFLEDVLHPELVHGGLQKYTQNAQVFRFHKHTAEIKKNPEMGRPAAFATPVAYVLEHSNEMERDANDTDRYHRGDAHHEALRQMSVNVQTRDGFAPTIWICPVSTSANLQRLKNAYDLFGVTYQPDACNSQLNVPLEALVLVGVHFQLAIQERGIAVVTGRAAAHAVWTAPNAIKYATNVVTWHTLTQAIRWFSKSQRTYRDEVRVGQQQRLRLTWAPHIAADPFGFAADMAVAEARHGKSKALSAEAVRALVLAASDPLIAPPGRANDVMQNLCNLFPATPQFRRPDCVGGREASTGHED